MLRKARTRTLLLRVAGLALFLFGFAAISSAAVPKRVSTLSDEVRHQLLMLPYYNVFDTLAFRIDSSNTVTLSGQVLRPLLRSEAEAAVRSVPGVKQVINNIEILPLSTYDNSIRIATYRAIFSRPGFEKYAIMNQPPIKIIVKNGNVTLEGVVDSALDKQLAYLAAQRVPGVFSVTNSLAVS